jgi:hypothetical protein
MHLQRSPRSFRRFGRLLEIGFWPAWRVPQNDFEVPLGPRGVHNEMQPAFVGFGSLRACFIVGSGQELDNPRIH